MSRLPDIPVPHIPVPVSRPLFTLQPPDHFAEILFGGWGEFEAGRSTGVRVVFHFGDPPLRSLKHLLGVEAFAPIDQLWTQSAPQRRQQALRILVRVVARQLVPLPGKEVDDEGQAS